NRAPNLRSKLEEPVRLKYGHSVVIGATGDTALYWLEEPEDLQPHLDAYRESFEQEKQHFAATATRAQSYDEVEELDDYSLRFQLKLLQQQLPEQVLSGWTNRTELYTRAASFIENSLPGQKGVTAAFVAIGRDYEGELVFHRLNPDAADRADFRPSKTLLKELDPNGKPTAIRIWTSREHSETFGTSSLSGKVDWVSAIPVAMLDEQGAIHRDRDRGWPVYLYVETRHATETAAAAFIPFLRLISALVAGLLSARDQQRIQDRMAAFFSPNLRSLMRDTSQSDLEPSMVDCTVMFADRRGSSRLLEAAKTDDQILDRLHENQEVVGLLTENIFDQHGLITDFAGDGVLGLWGWPQFHEDADAHAENALRSAVSIIENLADRVEFEDEIGRHMSAVRLGISTGRMAVGKTGPSQQWHISVFGVVANLGSRLERIAKDFKVPVLVSSETYERTKHLEEFEFRKLCLIRPVGFDEGYPIYELVLPKHLGGSGADPASVARYEKAHEHFLNKEWDKCIQLLDTLSADDEPSSILRERTERHRNLPPHDNWDGVFISVSK
ncbi:MAG: adenylate/guanylate cyclase domain-containing protein, partial [Verrucomicrobiota bacterium]